MADRLWALGVRVRRVMTAPDDLPDLIDVIGQASGLAPIVVCTGGLGPTRDDLTAEAVAAVTGRPLRLDPVALGQVEAMYARYSRRMPEVNRKQALLPEGAELLENRWGTAPGFRVAHGGARLSFLPG
ncbi:MAG: molybdopterin-binding protein, partial [bacterium]